MNAPAVQAGPVNSRRWAIVILLFIAVMINYIDRGNLSIAAVPAMRELGIAPSAMGTLLSAFFWTYALFQIPGSTPVSTSPSCIRTTRFGQGKDAFESGSAMSMTVPVNTASALQAA